MLTEMRFTAVQRAQPAERAAGSTETWLPGEGAPKASQCGAGGAAEGTGFSLLTRRGRVMARPRGDACCKLTRLSFGLLILGVFEPRLQDSGRLFWHFVNCKSPSSQLSEC